MDDGRNDRWNFGALLVQGVARRVGNELTSEKLVLPFLFTALGGPVFFTGLFAPVIILSRLAAQLIGARLVAVWQRGIILLAAAALLTAGVFAFIAAGSHHLPLVWLPAAFVGAAVLMGVFNGFGALAFQDLIGHVLTDRWRINLLFSIGAGSGAAVIAVTLVSQWTVGLEPEPATATDHLHMFWAGTAMMVLSASAALAVRERIRPRPAAKEAVAPYFASLFAGTRRVLKHDWFRRFMVARVLLIFVEMVLPFFAVHAATFHAATAPSLSIFVISLSLGMIAGGLVWPTVSRRSIQLVLALSSVVASLAALLAFLNHALVAVQSPFLHAGIIFLLAFGTQGSLDGSTAYVVRSSNDEDRPYCISVANVSAGVAGICVALAAGLLAEGYGVILALVLMGIINLATAAFVRTLPDVIPVSGDHAEGMVDR